MLPLTTNELASEAMVASKWPRRMQLTSNWKSVTLILYIGTASQSLKAPWSLKAPMSKIKRTNARTHRKRLPVTSMLALRMLVKMSQSRQTCNPISFCRKLIHCQLSYSVPLDLYELRCNSVIWISELQQLCNMVAGREDDFIPHDCIRIGNKLYNGKKLESWHPGGRLFIQGQ